MKRFYGREALDVDDALAGILSAATNISLENFIINRSGHVIGTRRNQANFERSQASFYAI